MYFLLFFLWIVFNGRITGEIVIIGLAICGWLYWFMCRHMGYSRKNEKIVLKNIPRFIRYFVILVWEIIKASIAVMGIILFKKEETDPAFFRFKTDLKTEFARTVLANSITLTSGTYTMQLEDGSYLVHGLDRSMGEDIDESVFVKELRKLEEKTNE